MCSLCAALGGSRYWTDAAGQIAFERGGKKVSLGAERARRVALIDAVLRPSGVSIADWGGNSYVLRNGRGRSANIFTLTAIWAEADALAEPCPDPLDADLIETLAQLPAQSERR